MSFPPPLEVKRQMLTNARDEFRQQGYRAELNIEALRVQDAGDGEDVGQQIASLEHSARNAYASARRMDEMLSKLPKPKEPKDAKK